jgi:hypothetical protein
MEELTSELVIRLHYTVLQTFKYFGKVLDDSTDTNNILYEAWTELV